MTIQSWQHIIDLVRNGEPVSAEVANRAIGQLVQRTEHLKDRQDAQDLAQAIYISDVPLADGVVAGNAVYFNPTINKFAAAYADIEFKNGVLQPTASSNVVGIVVYKSTSDSGVIVVEGWIDPDNYLDFDCLLTPMLTNMLTNSSHRGILYLASGAANAGKLLDKPGLLHIPVCNLVSPNHLLVRPPVTSSINTQALKFKLNNGIAGYELCLKQGSGSTDGAFTSKPDVGAQVKVYISNSASDTEDFVYFTGTVEKYSDLTNGNPRRIHLKDIAMTKELIQALDAQLGQYSSVLTPPTGKVLKIKVIGTTTSYVVAANGYSSYVAPVTYHSQNGWVITSGLTDNTKPGWLPVSDSVFQNAIIPANAKFGYNVSKDSVLQQLFPEGLVTAYIVTKDGIALSDKIVEVNESGIWWKDSILQAPWHTVGTVSIIPETQINLADWSASESASILMPSELHLAYVKLVTGGAKVVTSIETTEDSPIRITDLFGNPANSGPLMIKAGFNIDQVTNSELGSLVVKDFSGFQAKRGRVVERIIAGSNIDVSSSFSNGQGEVTIGVIGLEGKLEGQPDILTVDDVLVERDAVHSIFYSVFPPVKASSILGKIEIPSYLSGTTYNILLDMVFVALHTGSQSENLPPLSLTYFALPNFSAKGNLSSSSWSTAQEILPYANSQNQSIPVSSRDCIKKTVTLLQNATAGSSVFFKLARNSVSTDSYNSKLGLISFNYRFVKPS
jgi:hypothetical protein